MATARTDIRRVRNATLRTALLAVSATGAIATFMRYSFFHKTCYYIVSITQWTHDGYSASMISLRFRIEGERYSCGVIFAAAYSAESGLLSFR